MIVMKFLSYGGANGSYPQSHCDIVANKDLLEEASKRTGSGADYILVPIQ